VAEKNTDKTYFSSAFESLNLNEHTIDTEILLY
jgi:hypothetical protein